MKVFVLLVLILPLSVFAQDVRANVYDKFIKEQRVELQPLTILSGPEGKVALNFSAVSSTCYLEIMGTGWGASTIDEGNLLIFLFSNDSTVSLHATSLQTFDVGVPQNSYKHQYYISPAEVELFLRYNLVGIRKYSFRDFVDLSIPRELVPKIKNLGNAFLRELKKANVLKTLKPIMVKDIATYIGDTVQFCSKVYAVRVYDEANGNSTFLDTRASLSEPFINIIIPANERQKFGNNLERLYVNRNVCISGIVQLTNGIPQITIRNREQIVLKSTIKAEEALFFAGDSVTVVGRIQNGSYLSDKASGSTVLTMEDALGAKLSIVIENKDRQYFVDQPETLYQRKLVTVSGKVFLYQNQPRIAIRNSSQLKIMDENPSSEAKLKTDQ